MVNNDAGIAPEKKLAETSKVSVRVMEHVSLLIASSKCEISIFIGRT